MIRAAIFDKDGTLFDFRASWGGWTARVIDLCAAHGADRAALEQLLGYDAKARNFADDSPVIACTTPEIAALVVQAVPQMDPDALHKAMYDLAATAPMEPAVDLPAVLGRLRDRGLILGLATNDFEEPARTHLRDAGVLDLFTFVAGCDSGWGGKPAPGQLLAFAKATGLPPSAIAMVGDSRHDLEAGRAAGMARVAVLTGIAKTAELAPHADVVLPDIGHLAGWIAAQTRG